MDRQLLPGLTFGLEIVGGLGSVLVRDRNRSRSTHVGFGGNRRNRCFRALCVQERVSAAAPVESRRFASGMTWGGYKGEGVERRWVKMRAQESTLRVGAALVSWREHISVDPNAAAHASGFCHWATRVHGYCHSRLS